MKKLYKNALSLVFGLGLALTANSQVFPESFEGATFPPTGWVKFDNGIGTAQSWTTTTALVQQGTKAARIRYELVTGTAEDWLVTPSVLVSAATPSLSYWDAESFTAEYGSVYNVLISTSSQTDVATFTVVSTYPETTTTPTTYKEKRIDLSAYAGQNVYIAFRMDNNDGDNWNLDNLSMVGPCVNTPVAGTISGPTSVVNGQANSYTISPSVGNLQWYTGTSATGPWSAVAGATTTPANITASGTGTMYLTVIASNPGCVSDTANTALEINVVFPNDACDLVALPIGTTSTTYGLFGATVQLGEVRPTGAGCGVNNGWCNSTLNNTRWFSFVAPASGNVSVNSPGFDTQLAVWKAASCSDLVGQADSLAPTTATLVAANDDDANYIAHGGVQFSSYVSATCLTPGATYFIQLDSYSAATVANLTKVIVMDLGTGSAVVTATDATCESTCLDGSVEVVMTGGAAPYTYMWMPGMTTTALTPSVASGCYTVDVTNACGTTTQHSVCVGFPTGLKSVSKANNGISLYPNPTNGLITIETQNLTGNVTFEAYDALGKMVSKETLLKDVNTINISKLNNGIYMYKVINAGTVVKTGRVVKQ